MRSQEYEMQEEVDGGSHRICKPDTPPQAMFYPHPTKVFSLPGAWSSPDAELTLSGRMSPSSLILCLSQFQKLQGETRTCHNRELGLVKSNKGAWSPDA